MRLGGQGIAQKKSPYVNILLYPKENFNDRKTALGIPEILYNVIYSRPRVDDIVKDFWNPQCCFPIIKVLFGIKQYIYVG